MSAPKKRTVASLLICAVNQDDKQRLAVLYKAISFEKKAILEIERKQKRQQKQLEEEEEKVKMTKASLMLDDTRIDNKRSIVDDFETEMAQLKDKMNADIDMMVAPPSPPDGATDP